MSATSQKVTYESYLLSYRFLIQLNHLVAYGKSQPSSLYLSLQQPIATYSSQAALLHINYTVLKRENIAMACSLLLLCESAAFTCYISMFLLCYFVNGPFCKVNS